MNLLHLKYAVEVEKTRSINKAAENLFMSQPNLSRAIKELEESLGIKIFKRTSKGMLLTPQGEEFIQYAKKIIFQMDSLEAMYQNRRRDRLTFSISVPRASYISCAFTDFVKTLDSSKESELTYKETNSLRAVSNILEADYRLGIIRYQPAFEAYFTALLQEKGLDFQLIAQFSPVVVLSKCHPLAARELLQQSDLESFMEIAYPDPFVPSLSQSDSMKAELSDAIRQRIFVFERGSQLDLLSQLTNTFAWASPIPQRLLERYGLVEKRCADNEKAYKDLLIYKKDYPFSDLDRRFLEEIDKYKPHNL